LANFDRLCKLEKRGDEINDYNLGEFHEMNTTNNLNHEITSDTSIIDIDCLIGKHPYNA
jgi:hypothetical protein